MTSPEGDSEDKDNIIAIAIIVILLFAVAWFA